MPAELLDPVVAERLRHRVLTYRDIGATSGPAPPGFHCFSRSRALSRARRFDAAAAALMTWRVQLRAGLRVSASSLDIDIDIESAPSP